MSGSCPCRRFRCFRLQERVPWSGSRVPPKAPDVAKPSGYLVVEVGGKFKSPSIEAEIQNRRLFAVENADGTEIPCPCIVGGYLKGQIRSGGSSAPAMDRSASSISGATSSNRSYLVISFAMSIVTRCTEWRSGAQSVPAWGHAIRTPSCSSHSAGNLRVVSITDILPVPLRRRKDHRGIERRVQVRRLPGPFCL